MYYHDIETDSMLNGDGLRVVLWISGCRMNCPHCQNPETHDFKSGIPFDDEAENELFEALSKDWIDGITFSGGHPLEPENRQEVLLLIKRIKKELPNKSIWLYTGYTFEQILKMPTALEIVDLVDVLCDGKFVEELKDNTIPWVGSSNQRVLSKQDRKKIQQYLLTRN